MNRENLSRMGCCQSSAELSVDRHHNTQNHATCMGWQWRHILCTIQSPPPYWRYRPTMLQQCNVVNSRSFCQLLCVEIYGLQKETLAYIKIGKFQHFDWPFFTWRIPPTWRWGFVLSSVTSLHLMYATADTTAHNCVRSCLNSQRQYHRMFPTSQTIDDSVTQYISASSHTYSLLPWQPLHWPYEDIANVY